MASMDRLSRLARSSTAPGEEALDGLAPSGWGCGAKLYAAPLGSPKWPAHERNVGV